MNGSIGVGRGVAPVKNPPPKGMSAPASAIIGTMISATSAAAAPFPMPSLLRAVPPRSPVCSFAGLGSGGGGGGGGGGVMLWRPSKLPAARSTRKAVARA